MIYTLVMFSKRGVIKEQKSMEIHFVKKQTEDNGNNIWNNKLLLQVQEKKIRKTNGELGVK